MMKYTGIARAGGMLVSVLQKGLVPEMIAEPGLIGLCTPQEKGDFVLGVWLYDIRECMQLNRHEMVAVDDRRQRYPSVYVNLFYMITPYSCGDVKYRAEEEALMFGKILQTLKDAAVLELSGLEDADGGEPVCQIVLQNLSMEEKQRIYPAQGGYKASLFYEVGPLEISSEKERSVRRVVDISYDIGETDGNAAAVLRGGML